jgi:hypothetical protein
VVVNSQFIHEFRSRNNISEMKDYNCSRKTGLGKKASVEVPLNSRKKKPKSNPSSDFKDLRREIKPLMTTAPVLTTRRKDSTGKISSKTQKVAAGKAIKMTSRSTEFFRPKDKSAHGRHELINTGITMPLTSKLESLYSNTTSIFSSRTDLALQIYNQRQSCAIPTEESLDEITEIRRYESLAIHDMRRSSSKNLRKMSNISLVGELEDEKFKSSKQSTHKIIDYYLNYFNSVDANEESGSTVSKEIREEEVQ